MLERQLNQSILRENQSLERETFYQEQIEAMQRLLEAPKAPKMEDPTPVAPHQETVEVPVPEKQHEVENDIQTPNKRIAIPEHVDPEPKKTWLSEPFFPAIWLI